MPNSPQSEKSPALLLSVLTLLSLGFYLIIPNIFLMIASWVTGTNLEDIMRAVNADEAQPFFQNLFLIVQGLAAFTSFILVPILFIKYYEKGEPKEIFAFEGHSYENLVLVALMTIVFMVVNTPFIEWNMNIQYPEPFHSTVRELEDLAEKATKFLTNFYSIPYFLGSIIVIAIIPAIGEELLFRGMIQRYGMKIFSNPHIAIWVTAFVFSAFHLQFFGFIPRMLLGAFFGYLYFFSGNLWYSIAAHFTNNAFTILMLFLHQKGHTDFDIEGTDSLPWTTVIVFTIIGTILFVFFMKRMQKKII